MLSCAYLAKGDCIFLGRGFGILKSIPLFCTRFQREACRQGMMKRPNKVIKHRKTPTEKTLKKDLEVRE